MTDPQSRHRRIRDHAPGNHRFLRDVLSGLRRPQKTVPCKYLYDDRGSELFEEICAVEEYYPTRTELAIMRRHAGEMAGEIGPRCLLLEYGSGSSRKTRLLLDRLEEPAAYVPIDISRDVLVKSVKDLTSDYPSLEVLPVCADYTAPFDIPEPSRPADRKTVYFPGSTIGNFSPQEATAFLEHVRDIVDEAGALIIGVDLKKEPAILQAAYDDREGVTAEFNLNLLKRMNRELGSDFPVDRFHHRAVYDEERGRVEMHLVSEEDLTVRVGDKEFRFDAGETIHTENSYKFEVDQFAAQAARARLHVDRIWTDPEKLFSVQYLVAA